MDTCKQIADSIRRHGLDSEVWRYIFKEYGEEQFEAGWLKAIADGKTGLEEKGE